MTFCEQQALFFKTVPTMNIVKTVCMFVLSSRYRIGNIMSTFMGRNEVNLRYKWISRIVQLKFPDLCKMNTESWCALLSQTATVPELMECFYEFVACFDMSEKLGNQLGFEGCKTSFEHNVISRTTGVVFKTVSTMYIVEAVCMFVLLSRYRIGDIVSTFMGRHGENLGYKWI